MHQNLTIDTSIIPTMPTFPTRFSIAPHRRVLAHVHAPLVHALAEKSTHRPIALAFAKPIRRARAVPAIPSEAAGLVVDENVDRAVVDAAAVAAVADATADRGFRFPMTAVDAFIGVALAEFRARSAGVLGHGEEFAAFGLEEGFVRPLVEERHAGLIAHGHGMTVIVGEGEVEHGAGER